MLPMTALFCSALATDGLTARDTPQETFRDVLRSGDRGPEMVVIPPGRFRMGCDRGTHPVCGRSERPAREVYIASSFAMSKHEVTFDDYDRYLKAKGGGRNDEAHDHGWGRGRRPVIHVTRTDVRAYAAWLSAQTGARYRLPSEAEWEYAARAGTETNWPWGDEFLLGRANCRECGSRWDGERTAPVGSFPPNLWGLHDMIGNVYEMLLDCAHLSQKGRANRRHRKNNAGTRKGCRRRGQLRGPCGARWILGDRRPIHDELQPHLCVRRQIRGTHRLPRGAGT